MVGVPAVGVAVPAVPPVPPPGTPVVTMLKVAVTERAWLIVGTHDPIPEHAPVQPSNVEPVLAASVNVTDVPELYASVQSEPQSIPAGLLVTVPNPVPLLLTVRGCVT